MIVQLYPEGRLTLQAADEFTRLHCEFDRAGLGLAPQDGAFDLDGDDSAWIAIEWLRGQAPGSAPDWGEQFDQMIASAKRHGWVDVDRRRVRAHVLWSDRSARPATHHP